MSMKSDPLHPDKVKKWIKTQQRLASEEKRNERLGVKGSTQRRNFHEAYVRSMNKYLRDGMWVDLLYGEHQENIMRYRCVTLAYDNKGNPKRNVGTFYPDVPCIYTREMFVVDKQ
jgi:hypothetical protein